MHPCRRSYPSWKKTTKASCGILPVFLISCDMNRKPERMIEEKDSQKAERSINNCLCFFLSRIFQMKSEYLYEYLPYTIPYERSACISDQIVDICCPCSDQLGQLDQKGKSCPQRCRTGYPAVCFPQKREQKAQRNAHTDVQQEADIYSRKRDQINRSLENRVLNTSFRSVDQIPKCPAGHLGI